MRNDTGVYEGGEISIHYDPMIAKLVTHAPTRAAAIDAQANALDAFVIDGIRHNIPFLSALMQHPRWRAGRLSTGFIAEEFPEASMPIAPEGEMAETIAAVAAADRPRAGRAQAPHLRPDDRPRGDARAPPRGARSAATGDLTSLDVGARGRGHRRASRRRRAAMSARRACWLSAWKPGDPVWTGLVDGQPVAVQVRPIANGFVLAHRGVEARAYVYTEREAAARAPDAGEEAARHRQVAALPDAGPGPLDRGRRRARRSRPARRSPWSRR